MKRVEDGVIAGDRLYLILNSETECRLISVDLTTHKETTLDNTLQAKGDPAGYIPALLSKLRSLPIKDRVDSPTLEVVSHSSHPEAVAFMIQALKDPKAAHAWREVAFKHLAGTGGTAG